MNDFMFKMNASDATLSVTDAKLNPNDAILNLNDVILSSYCFITICFSDQSHMSTSPYHSVVYFNDAINSLAGLC